MYNIKLVPLIVLLFSSNYLFSQKTKVARQHVITKSASNNYSPVEKLSDFFNHISKLCSQPLNDKEIKLLLSDNLKANKQFLNEWEIGLNNKDAQIWHVVCALSNSPYVIDSSNKAKIMCKIPFIKERKKVPGSLGILQILPKEYLDTENEHDVIYIEPDAQSKAMGKVQPGEQYRYYAGTTGYSASAKQYVANTYKYDGEGDIGFYAIELNNAEHTLGYISTNATYLSFPLMQLQYITGQWKITKLAYQ